MPARTYMQMRSIAANDNVMKLAALKAAVQGNDPLQLPLLFDKSAYVPTNAEHRR